MHAPQPILQLLIRVLSRAAEMAALLLVAFQLGGMSATDDEAALSVEEQLRRLSDLSDPRPLRQFIDAHPATDPADRFQQELAWTRQRILEPGIARAERTRRVQQALDLRQALIDQAPRDPRRAIWQLDQAADLY